MLSQTTTADRWRGRMRAIALEGRLRRVTLGSRGTMRPELVLSVHATDGSALGYAVIDRSMVGRTWGGLTSSEHGSIEEVCLLARAATLQMRFHGLRSGSHHCVLSLPAEMDAHVQAMRREEFLAALRPLTDNGLCTIIYGGGAELATAAIVRRGLAASASAAIRFALEQMRIKPAGGGLACPHRTSDVDDVIAALADHGVETVGATDKNAHVTLLDGPVELRPAEVRRLRTSAIVSLQPLLLSHRVARSLHERGVLVISEAAAAGGRFVALDLCHRGLDLESALRLTSTTTRERLRQSLGHANARGSSPDIPERAFATGS
jgi:hypothetical protein